METIKFMSSHGVVYGEVGDCVSLTFGMNKNTMPHTPISKGGILRTITTMCDHDIGVIVYERESD